MITLTTQPPKKLKPVDQELIESIRDVTEENMRMAQENRAERVRRNVLTMDATLHKSRKRATQIRVGDEVSYRGEAYKVTALQAHTQSGPSKATIQTPDGFLKVVKFHDLTGLADPTPELMLEHPTAPLTKPAFHRRNRAFGPISRPENPGFHRRNRAETGPKIDPQNHCAFATTLVYQPRGDIASSMCWHNRRALYTAHAKGTREPWR